MSRLVSFRTPAHVVAPLREGRGAGAQATSLWQDKSDSLRLCPAVVLSFLVSTFVQPANSWRSLSIFACDSISSAIFTSLRHVS
jgi:hypothetical protein